MTDPTSNGEEPKNVSQQSQEKIRERERESSASSSNTGKGVTRRGLLQNAGGIAAAVAALGGASQKPAAASSLAPLGPTPGTPMPWHPAVSTGPLHANLASRHGRWSGR